MFIPFDFIMSLMGVKSKKVTIFLKYLNICFGNVRVSFGLEIPLLVSEDQTEFYMQNDFLEKQAFH